MVCRVYRASRSCGVYRAYRVCRVFQNLTPTDIDKPAVAE